MNRRHLIFATVFLALAGCVVGPNYRRPVLPVPESFRAPEPLTNEEAGSIASLKWFEVFKDEKLQELIRTALVKNYDLRDAAARVEEAQASLDKTKSTQVPNFGGGASLAFNRVSREGATQLP